MEIWRTEQTIKQFAVGIILVVHDEIGMLDGFLNPCVIVSQLAMLGSNVCIPMRPVRHHPTSPEVEAVNVEIVWRFGHAIIPMAESCGCSGISIAPG